MGVVVYKNVTWNVQGMSVRETNRNRMRSFVVVVGLPQRVFEEGLAAPRRATGRWDHTDGPVVTLIGVWVRVSVLCGLLDEVCVFEEVDGFLMPCPEVVQQENIVYFPVLDSIGRHDQPGLEEGVWKGFNQGSGSELPVNVGTLK